MAFQHETVTLPCGEFDIGLKQILRKKLFQRQLTRSRAFVCQRLHCCQLLLLCNIVRPPIDRLVFCLAIWQAHGDIPRLPATVFPVINVLSVFRQVLHLSFLPESWRQIQDKTVLHLLMQIYITASHTFYTMKFARNWWLKTWNRVDFSISACIINVKVEYFVV